MLNSGAVGRVSSMSAAEQTEVDGSTTTFQACSLSPSTLYRFTVSAITRSGRLGPPTERSYWTEVSVPPIPAPASLTDVTDTTITLLLQPISSSPTLPTSIITYFIVVDDVSDTVTGRRKRQLDNTGRLSRKNFSVCSINTVVSFLLSF